MEGILKSYETQNIGVPQERAVSKQKKEKLHELIDDCLHKRESE